MELIELFDEWDELTKLVAEGHVDKAAFRDACTEWLVDMSPCGTWMEENLQPGDGDHELLAAPEFEHIEHTAGIELPCCVAGGEPCEEDDCGCDLTWMIPDDRPGAVALTVWDLRKTGERYRFAALLREGADHAD